MGWADSHARHNGDAVSWLDVLVEIIYAIFASAMLGGATWLVLRWVLEVDWRRRDHD